MGLTWVDDPGRCGHTLLTLVETGIAQLSYDAHRKAYDSHTQGWASELGRLVDHLDAA